MRRKGFKYEKNKPIPCPKCSYETSQTKDLSMSSKFTNIIVILIPQQQHCIKFKLQLEVINMVVKIKLVILMIQTKKAIVAMVIMEVKVTVMVKMQVVIQTMMMRMMMMMKKVKNHQVKAMTIMKNQIKIKNNCHNNNEINCVH